MEIGNFKCIKCVQIQIEVVNPNEQIEHRDIGLDLQVSHLCPFWILESLMLLITNRKQHFFHFSINSEFLSASIWSLLHFYGFFITIF